MARYRSICSSLSVIVLIIVIIGMFVCSLIFEDTWWFINNSYQRINGSDFIKIIKRGDIWKIDCVTENYTPRDNESNIDDAGVTGDVDINNDGTQLTYCDKHDLDRALVFVKLLWYIPVAQFLIISLTLTCLCQAKTGRGDMRICSFMVYVFGTFEVILIFLLLLGPILYATVVRAAIGFKMQDLQFLWYIYISSGVIESLVSIILTCIEVCYRSTEGICSISLKKKRHSEDWMYEFIPMTNCRKTSKQTPDIDMSDTADAHAVEQSPLTGSCEAVLGASYLESLINEVHLLDQPDMFGDIRTLVNELWKPRLIGIGRDARNLRHTSIIIDEIERVRNEDLLGKYHRQKEQIKQNSKLHGSERIPALELHQQRRRSVETSILIDTFLERSELRSNIDKDVNEYYLFHGTSEECIHSIKQNGFDITRASPGLLGKGIYFTESPVKADQYAGRVDGSSVLEDESTTYQMLLSRVTLGHLVIRTVKGTDCRYAESPPCKDCRHLNCDKPRHEKTFDSVVFDRPESLFREFVIYNNYQAYPEYIIKYRRIS